MQPEKNISRQKPFEDNNFSHLVKECRRCVICRQKCLFLQTYGSPGIIRKAYLNDPIKWQKIAFLCSLCGRCTAVCPRKYAPAQMFLEFRRKAVKNDLVDFKRYKPLLDYEKMGMSKGFRFYYLPPDCRSVFFPGCALAGTRPKLVEKTFKALQQIHPRLGIILDCCIKPSHDLGRQDFFMRKMQLFLSRLKKQGIRRLIVTCPSCLATFKTYAHGMDVQTAYEILSARQSDAVEQRSQSVVIHDACQARFDPVVHHSIRTLVKKKGIRVEELPDNREKTLCCGEGGAVGFLSPPFADDWTDRRLKDFNNQKTACYCAGCTARFDRKADAFHVLDLFFDPDKALAGRCRGTPSPMTYSNRLILKFKLLTRLGLKHTDLF